MAPNSKLDKRLKNLLVRYGLITEDQAQQASAAAAEQSKPFAAVLVDDSIVDERQMIGVISRETSIPPIDLEKISVEDDVIDGFGQDLANYYGVVPVARVDNIMTMAVSDPFDVLKLDDVRIITNCDIRPVVSTESSIKTAIDRIYNKRQREMDDLLSRGDGMEMVLSTDEEVEEDFGDDLMAIKEGDESSPVVKLVNLLIMEAIQKGSSDIHVEPMEKKVRVRYRIDGVLQEVFTPPKKMQAALVSRLKVMSELDIAEKRKPQDGKFQMKVDGRNVDFRVSILPLIHGEKTVLRILDSSSLSISLDSLGFEPKCLEDFRWAISQPYGLILVTGPTGSGKSTTLYSGLKEILNPEDNVITVEDPVEYQLEGVNQVPVNVKRGLTFAAALRSILRQDPDKIMIGEIRDTETIEIAVKAALTGHLVLSTIHTNDSAQAITRIIDMGIDNFLVATTGLLFTAQRLARKLCKECKQSTEVKEEKLLEMQFKPEEIEGAKIFRANPDGCPRCARGYKGRTALVESLRMTDAIKESILENKSALEIKKTGIAENMLTLRRAGIMNVLKGNTSIEEMIRVTMAD
ncbi:MAG: GspE/PulE family protein [Planctomycetota bacterium]|jgi:type IV pilus assembly protein PilB